MDLLSAFHHLILEGRDQLIIQPSFLSVTAFFRVGQESLESRDSPDVSPERLAQEREFQIGSIGLADSLGILMASVLAVPTEVALCKAQVARGRMLCRWV